MKCVILKKMSKIDITPLEEEEPIKPKKDDIVRVERLRHENFMKELDKLKEIISESKHEKEEVIEQKPISQPMNYFITNPINPMAIPQIPKKKFKVPTLIYFILMFIFSSGAGYVAISSFFTADAITQAGITIGTGFFVTMIIGMIYLFVTRKSIDNFQYTPETRNHELSEITSCPLCKGKIAKSQVYQSNNQYKQMLKCLNPICDFKKELSFGL